MNIYLRSCLVVMVAGMCLSLRVSAAEEPSAAPPRMANGTMIEGTVEKATPEGLIIQGSKGQVTAPWKYLSTGTRYRYERPMLIEQEIVRSNALKKAQAEAAKKEAEAKAAAVKAAAKAAKARSNVPPAKAAGTATNAPAAK